MTKRPSTFFSYLTLIAAFAMGISAALTSASQAQCQGPGCLATQPVPGVATGIGVTAVNNQKDSDTCYWVTWGVVQFLGGAQPKIVQSGVGADIGDRAYCSSAWSTGDVKRAFEQALRDRYRDAKSISVEGIRVSTSPHTARMWRDNAVNRLKKYYGVSQVTPVQCLSYLEG
jgi:hypothetical protein